MSSSGCFECLASHLLNSAPIRPQELQGLVFQCREDMVALRTSADHMEEKLKAEILFLKEQIQAEQCLKENLEETLQLEIEGCKEEIGESGDRLRRPFSDCWVFCLQRFFFNSIYLFLQTSWKV